MHDQIGPLGILAGGGQLPNEVAEAVAATGRRVHIVGLEGEAEGLIEAHPHAWVNWGGIGAMVRSFQDAGCREIVILGSVRRPNLRKIRPDLGFFLALPGLLKMLKGGDDSVLRRVVAMFEARGLSVRGVHEVAPGLVAPEGPLASRRPDPIAERAIALGRHVLDIVGPFDLGQAVVAHAGGIVEIEGAEGTDAMLERLASTGHPDALELGPLVLVKAPKPGQEIRVDMPAIGPRTVQLAKAAGLAGLALEAGSVLVADRLRTMSDADAAGLFIVGSKRSGAPAIDAPRRLQFVAAGSVKPSPMLIDDAATGAAALDVLKPDWGPGAVAVSRSYILAIEKPATLVRAVERARLNKPWGMSLLKRGVGVLVVGREVDMPLGLVEQVAKQGFAALAFVDSTWAEGVVEEADELGIAVLVPGAEA
ncbi:MAG: hypothetical protein RLZ98_345 [Pseudomonadota bacterium]|jgi:DUF1009 family protein